MYPGSRPRTVPTTLRRPPGTCWKRPRGSRRRRRRASRREGSEPAGRGPSSTWYSSSCQAAPESKRSTFRRAGPPSSPSANGSVAATSRRPASTAPATTLARSFTTRIVAIRVRRRVEAGSQGPPQRNRRLLPAPGEAVLPHARRRTRHLRGAPTGARGLRRAHPVAPAARAALPPAARLPALRDGPALLGGRPELQPRLPRQTYRLAAAGLGGPAAPARRPHLLPAARPLEAALGGLARAGPRGEPLRADLEDPPRAGGRRLGRRHRNGAVRPRARAGAGRGG